MPSLYKSLAGALLAASLAAPMFAAEAPRGQQASIAIEPLHVQPYMAVLPDMNAFATLDKNHDGYLSPDELGPDFCGMFKTLDTDGDGLISPAEFQDHAARRSLLADIVKAYMLRNDKNRDGLLERDEFHGRPAAFVYADQDENNVLHNEELMRLLGSDMMIEYDPALFFKAHDLDSDGRIVIDEWNKVERSPDLFHAMDYNHDGVVTPCEAELFLYRYERRLAPLGETVAKKTVTNETHKAAKRFVGSKEGQG